MLRIIQVAEELAEEAQDLNQAIQEEHSDRLQALKASQEDRFRFSYLHVRVRAKCTCKCVYIWMQACNFDFDF